MSYTVYVLYSSTFEKHYTGYTSDLTNRMLSHNHWGNDWTARYRPRVPTYVFPRPNECVHFILSDTFSLNAPSLFPLFTDDNW
ncbi:MAG TPA: GIY-YIG nuclease family protein [Agriterribacter sp.]|nr:GIY-YIG nuclease family protein [Chitinophagaceae bacterium]HRP30588.1 GIY-YIG nuclease family protein [Agriterribacter sp.]